MREAILTLIELLNTKAGSVMGLALCMLISMGFTIKFTTFWVERQAPYREDQKTISLNFKELQEVTLRNSSIIAENVKIHAQLSELLARHDERLKNIERFGQTHPRRGS